MAEKSYNAESIEVLSGLEPVRKRPGMYTDTSRPNHLAQELIDNSVDEALAGFAKNITVSLYKDGSIEVSDDGRGMPVDLHPVHKLPGVELILSRLHSGAKFSSKDYRFSGGLHGVGVSVVNALAKKLDVSIQRDGYLWQMSFANGERAKKLQKVEKLSKKQSGTTVRFWPDSKYFDSDKIAVAKLKHLLQAKAVLCPGLKVTCAEYKGSGEPQLSEWFYTDGMSTYLLEHLSSKQYLPADTFSGDMRGNSEEVSWSLVWDFNTAATVQESFVNLVPTAQGGTHVSGLRQGLTDAIREFCELQGLLTRGVKISADDVYLNLNYILSLKLQEAQFSGQTKERLSSRQAAAFVAGVVKDNFSLWLNQHVAEARELSQNIIEIASARQKADKQVVRKKVSIGPALPGKLSDCTSSDLSRSELFLVEGDSAGGSAKQARDKEFQAIMPLRGKILNTWELESSKVLASKEVHDIAVALGVDPGDSGLSNLRYGKICILADADSDGLHIATLLCALFVKHFKALVKAGHVYVAMPPLYRIDIGKQVFYALDDDEKQGILDRIAAEKLKGKVNVQRFKGLGEMNPEQLRVTTMAEDTRRLVRLQVDDEDATNNLMDMLLAKKRAADRKAWLEQTGDKYAN